MPVCPALNFLRKGQFSMARGGRRPPSMPPPFVATRLDAEALRIGAQIRDVRIGGSIESLTMTELVIRKQVESAISGSPLAQKSFLERADRSERLQSEVIDLICDNFELMREAQAKRIAMAKARGEDTTLILPHPDDIVIERGKGVRIVGPVDEEDFKRTMNTVHVRDAFLYQDSLDASSYPKAFKRPAVLGEPLCFASILNNALPSRLRLSDIEIVLRMERLRSRTRRDLLKATRAAWIKAGVRRRRGALLPPVAQMAKVLEVAYATAPLFFEARGNMTRIQELAEDAARQISSYAVQPGCSAE